MLRCRLEALSACMSADVDEEVWRFFREGTLRLGWVPDGWALPPPLLCLPPPSWWTSSLLWRWDKKKGRPLYLLAVHFEPSIKGVYSFPTPARGYVTPTQVAPCQCFHWAPSPPPPPTLGSSPRRCHGRRHRKFWLASEPRLSRLPSCHDAAVNRFRVCHWQR